MSSVPNVTNASSGIAQPTPVQTPPAVPKKSALLSTSAIAEQAKKDQKKKTNNDKTAAKLSRKAAEKKKTKITTTLQGLKEALCERDTSILSDMEISDEERPSPAIGTQNRYAALGEVDQQEDAHPEPMLTDDSPAAADGKATKEAPNEPSLPPAPVTPPRLDRHLPMRDDDTPGGGAPGLDDFVRRHAQSINFSSPPNSSPYLKSAAKVGLIGPNKAAFTAPTPDHEGDEVQELFPQLPANDKAQAPPPPSKETQPPSAPVPTSESDAKLLSRLHLAATYATVATPAQTALTESEYTPGPFPMIHDPHPVHALAFIDEQQILAWNRTPGGKFIARLFDPAREPRFHATIASIIQQAVATITNSPKARVATPVGKYPSAQADITPNSFFVFNISEEAARTMIKASIWSSTVITFQALELNPKLPTYLFPVSGFSTWTPDDTIEQVIKARWLADDSVVGLRALIAHSNEEPDCAQPLTEAVIVEFINSLTVSRIETKAGGGHLRPTHRLHADPSVLKSESHLYDLRAHLRTLEYPTHYDGSGVPEPDWDCPICHSIDHPKGMCPFPDVPGWNGPRRSLEKKEKPLRGKAPARGNTRGAGRGRGMKRPY